MNWNNHKIKVIIGAIVVVLVVLSVVGLANLESFYRKITIAQLPMTLLLGGIHSIIFVGMYLMIFRGGFARFEKKDVKASEVKVSFDDVIGIDEAKEEAWEVVKLITDHQRLKKIGGKILKGILMMGPPGCGKTYLAKAIAHESKLPFLSMAASEFVEVFVGVGASRVRSLFKRARSLAYGFGGCIIFLDELDALGKNRTFNQFGNSETNSTLNQILAEMDGLSNTKDNIVVIGATNAPEEILDPALLRPGRFDRKVYLTRPSLDGREKLFEYYLSTVKHDPEIDCKVLARKAIRKTPADIENIVKESALIAARKKKELVTYKEISEAIERIELGIKTRIKMPEKEKRMTAFHEAGHLIALFLLHPTDDVFKASIIPRKESLGVVHPQPREEKFTTDRDELLADIKVDVAGFAAEKLVFNTTTSGVSSDFAQAMQKAHTMVWQVGMGGENLIGDFSSINPKELSDKVKADLNRQTNEILKQCIQDVENLLTTERKILDRFADELYTREELEYDDIEAIFREYGKENPRLHPIPKVS